jgi:hypothetical protein
MFVDSCIKTSARNQSVSIANPLILIVDLRLTVIGNRAICFQVSRYQTPLYASPLKYVIMLPGI